MTNTPLVGGFQEIDGRRIYVHKSGSGGPAVVFLPGASAVGLDYFHLQQRVAEFSTAVVYDRGGTGYSDPLPLPRTGTAVATELRELLRAWRDAKASAWRAVIDWAVRGALALLLVGIAFRIGAMELLK